MFHCVAIPLWIVPVDLMCCLEYTELMATAFMTKVQINYNIIHINRAMDVSSRQRL